MQNFLKKLSFYTFCRLAVEFPENQLGDTPIRYGPIKRINQ